MKYILLMVVLLVLLLWGCAVNTPEAVSPTQQDILDRCKTELAAKGGDLDFMKEYVIAQEQIQYAQRMYELSHISASDRQITIILTERRGENVNREAVVEEYEIYQMGFLKSKEDFEKARDRLTRIKDAAPDDFFQTDIGLQLNFVNAFIKVAESRAQLNQYDIDEANGKLNSEEALQTIAVYEYGKQRDIHNPLADAVKTTAEAINDHWEQDWHVPFPAVAAKPTE